MLDRRGQQHGMTRSTWRPMSVAVLELLMTFMMLHMQFVDATCTAGNGWQSYPAVSSSIICPSGSIIVGIQPFAAQWNNLGYNGVPSSYNITCSDGTILSTNNGAGSLDTNWPLVSCANGFTGMVYRADSTLGVLYNIEPQCNGMTTMLLGSYRMSSPSPLTTCNGGDFIGLQSTYNSQLVQCIESICNTTVPVRPISVFEYNNPARGGGKASLMLNGRALIYGQVFDFGSTPPVTPLKRFFRIRNPGTTPIMAYAINATLGYDTSKWSITCSSITNQLTGSLGSGYVIAPGASLAFNVTYTGAVAAQADTLQLFVYTNASIYKTWTANMTAHSTLWSVLGNCGTDVYVQDRDPAAASASSCFILPTITKSYSDQTATNVVILTNAGSTGFTFGVTVINEGAYQSEITIIGSATSGSLEPGDSRTYGFQFQPSMGGLREAIVMITTDDASQATFMFTVRGYGSDQQLQMIGIGTNSDNGDGTQYIQERGSIINWGDVPYGWPKQVSSPAVSVGRTAIKMIQFTNIGSYGDLHVFIPQLNNSNWRVNMSITGQSNLNFTIAAGQSTMIYLNLTSSGHIGYNNDTVQVWADEYMWLSQFPNGYQLNFSVAHTVVELVVSAIRDDYTTAYGSIYNGKLSVNLPDGTAFIGTNYFVGVSHLFAMDQFSYDNTNVNITSFSLTGPGASQYSVTLNVPRAINHGAIAYFAIKFNAVAPTLPLPAVVTIVTDLPRGLPTSTYQFGIAGVAMGMRWVSPSSTTLQIPNALFIPVNSIPVWYQVQLWIASPNGANSSFAFTCSVSIGVNATQLQFSTSVNSTTTTWLAPSIGYSSTPMQGNLTCTNLVSSDIIYTGAPLPALPIYIQGRITFDRSSVLLATNSDTTFQLLLSHVTPSDIQIAVWSPSSLISMAATWTIPAGAMGINITVHATAATTNVIKFSATSLSWAYNMASIDDLPFTTVPGCGALNDQPGDSGIIVNNHSIAAVGDIRYLSCHNGYILSGIKNATCTSSGWTNYTTSVCSNYAPILLGGGFYMDGIYFTFDRNMSSTVISCQNGLESLTLFAVQATAQGDASSPVCYWGNDRRTWIVKWAVSASLVVGETIALKAGVFYSDIDSSHAFEGDSGIPSAPTVGLPTTLNVTIIGPDSTRQQPTIGKCDSYALTALVAGDVAGGRNGLMATYAWSILDADQIPLGLKAQGYSQADCDALGNSILGAVALANAARDSTSIGTSLIGYPSWTVPASIQTGNFSVTWQLSVTHWTGIKVNTSYTVFVSKLIAPNITFSAGINSTAIYGDMWNNTATVSLARPQCTSTLALTWWTQWSLVAVINGTMPSANVMKIINSTNGSPSATLSLNTSVLTLGATYVFSVTTQNQTAFVPGLTRLAGNRTVTLTIGALVVVDPTYTPVVVGARLSNDATMIMISWDVPTDQPFGTIPFSCDKVLAAGSVAVLGTGALCVWYNTTTLAVMPSADATYDLTTMFTTQGNTVKSTSGLSSTSISATVPLWLPMIPPVPSITIAGNTTMVYCQSMTFTTNVTSGAAGRAILSYAWNVTDVTAGNISLQTGTSASITINQLLLTAERPTRVSVNVTNWLSVSSITQFWITSTLAGVLPLVSLVGSNTRTIARVDVLQLETSIIYGVCGNPGMSYLWTKMSGPVLQTGGVSLTESSLIIPTKRFSTAGASYIINLRSWMTSSPSLFITFNVTIAVTSSPLIATLNGIAPDTELFLSRANAAPLALNASLSSDPDAADALRHTGLIYTWSCTWLTNGARCFPSGSGADNIVVATTTADISIPMSQLSDTTTADAYVFLVSVAKDVRVTNASVIIHVLSAAQLTVTTKVQSSGVVISDGIVAPSLPFEIVSSMDRAVNQTYTYAWSCKTSTGSIVNLTQMARAGRLRTGLTGPYLAFYGGVLSSSVTYQFTVVITQVSTGITGTSIVSVAMDSGATGGTCTISPTSGDVSTVFVATCSNWQANGAVPLSYVWRATSADGSPFQLTTGTSATIQLAPGVAPLNQRSITTLITNARGTAITIITNLTVTALSANTNVNSVINSFSGRLTAAAAASDPAAFSQAYAISTSLLSSLNNTARTALCNALVAGVLGLANGTVATADSVAQRIALVSQVTSTAATDLTADARASLAKLLVETTEAALSLGACSPALATSALTALGDVISAASTNYSSASVTNEATSLATAFTATLSAASRGLVNGQLPGETVIISTPSVTLQAAQDDPDTMAGSSYSIGGQTFALPSSLFGQLSSSTPSSVGYSASVQNASLFNYAANGTTSGSPLVSISLFDASSSGGVLNVSGLTDGIDITINHANISVVDSNDVSNTVSSDLTMSPPRAVPTCRWFNFNLNAWSTAGCSRVAALSTSTRTVCRCTHLTDFNIELGTFHAPTVTPITVQDILNLADLPRHPTAMIWLAGLWALYFILVPFARRTDEKKHLMREVVPQTKHDPGHWRHPSMKGASRFQRWRAYVRDHFKYDHLWFSVALRRANDNFSSIERLTCVFVVIIGSMAISAAFWSHDQGGRIGTILVGVISSVALMPASAGLRFIFRRAGTDPTGGINHEGAIRKDQFIRMKTARMGGLPSSALANDTNPGDKYKSAAPLPSLPAAALPDGSVAVEMSTPTAVPRSNQIAPSSPPMSGGARVSPQPSDAAPLLPTGGSRAGSSSSPPPASDRAPLVGRVSVTAKKRSLADGELGAIKHGAFGVDKELPREEVKLAGRTSGATTPPAVTATSPNNNGATEEKTAMLPAAAAGSTALAEPTTATGDNGTMKGTSSSEELFDHHGKKKQTRKRCCCAPPKSLPLYWKNIGWAISILWALGCSFIILVYGVKFDEFDNGDSVGYSTASRWMLSSLYNTIISSIPSMVIVCTDCVAKWFNRCSNVQAVFVNEPVSILVKASLSVFFGNLILKAVECIADTDLTS